MSHLGLKAPAYSPSTAELAPAYGEVQKVDTGLEVQRPRRGLRPLMERPRVLSSAEVMLSSASSVLRPDLPGSVPPRDFTCCAYTRGPAVHGCFRRGRSRSSLCSSSCSIVPLPIPRRTSGLRAPILDAEKLPSPFGTRLGVLTFPANPLHAGYIDEAAGFT